MRVWAHAATAHGGNVVTYFRWRRCRMGQEQYHSGLRERDGSADMGYRDADQAATDLAGIANSVGGEDGGGAASGGVPGSDLSVADGDVALLHSYDNLWAMKIEDVAPAFDYW
jgi:beta-galactosidase